MLLGSRFLLKVHQKWDLEWVTSSTSKALQGDEEGQEVASEGAYAFLSKRLFE